MSEPVNLDALREAMRNARGLDNQPPIEPPVGKEAVKKHSGKRFRTYGFGTLSPDEQEQFQRELRAQSIDFRVVGKGADREIILPPTSMDGDMAGIITGLLAKFGLAIG